jgi:hypothetical protein
MARVNATTLLANRLLDELRRSRERDSDLPTLRRLAQQAAADASEADILKAASGKTPLAANAVFLQAKNLDSPVALKEDEGRLVRDPHALLFLLEQTATPQKPAVEPNKLTAKAAKSLRGPLDREIAARIENDRLPNGIALVRSGRKELLHLARLPLPRVPEDVLAEQMIARLRLLRNDQEPAYPAKLSDLQREVHEAESAVLWK